ncbi:MAG: hypothetical protein HY335_04565, partial [Deinococcus sp.]|nr:hypothetical protein [Deinococcus sp.]
RGMVLVAEDEKINASIARTVLPPPFLQSSHQVNQVAALAVALAEMLEFGQAYAAQIVKNSQALAKGLVAREIKLLGKPGDYTRSHQVILDCGGIASKRAFALMHQLEEANIITDCVVRLGTQQPARLGMGEKEMGTVAEIVSGVASGELSPAKARRQVKELVSDFQKIHFCFEEDAEAFQYFSLAAL